MGGDIALTWFTLPMGEKPEEAKTRLIAQVKALDEDSLDELLTDALENLHESHIEDMDEGDEIPFDEAQKIVLDVIEEGFKRIPYRDVAWINVGGPDVYITGGMSWGESPTGSYDHIEYLGAVIDKLDEYKSKGETDKQ